MHFLGENTELDPLCLGGKNQITAVSICEKNKTRAKERKRDEGQTETICLDETCKLR